MSVAAILVLEDGSVFRGTSIGAEGSSTGEVVFNTAMTGYQEILTDPSYARQMVTLTYPHIGNTGTTPEDGEANDVHAAGLIVREVPRPPSSWRNTQSLPDYLAANKTVAIADIDTRRLTRILRSKGAQRGCILAGSDAPDGGVSAAKAELAKFPGMQGMDLAKEVTVSRAYDWTAGTWQLEPGERELDAPKFNVVAYDFGVKQNILRILRDNGCAVHVVPAQTPAADVLAMKPDGVFLSNGPGDPEPCDYAIAAIKELLDSGIPLFGICLGHQLLALAAGAQTEKMKFGHHGANHPVQDLATNEVMITSQNHGFAVSESSLPANVKPTHRSLFDGSLQGIELTDKPAYSFQGHPEASPGPHDIKPLFERFTALMNAAKS